MLVEAYKTSRAGPSTMPAETPYFTWIQTLRGMGGTIPTEEDSLSGEDFLHFPIYDVSEVEDSLSGEDFLHFPIYDVSEVESKLLPRNVTMKNLLYMSYSTVNQLLYKSKIA